MGGEDIFHLHLHPTTPFIGKEDSYQDSDYIIIGVPSDRTYTYRPGQRFAPQRIREASQNLETYHLDTEIDVEDLKIADLGDLNVSYDVQTTLDRLTQVVKTIFTDNKLPIVLGGEHTLTLGILAAYEVKPAIIDLDAHPDLRCEYQEEKIGHATFMRRYIEENGAEDLYQLGVRAVSREEVEYAKSIGHSFYTTESIRERIRKKKMGNIAYKLSGYSKKHLSIDMDVFDPSYAPAVGNPEPFGLTPFEVKNLIKTLVDNVVTSIDIVEVAPNNDSDQTSILAAKIIFELIAQIQDSKRK